MSSKRRTARCPAKSWPGTEEGEKREDGRIEKTGRKSRGKGDIDIRCPCYKENLIRTAARSLSGRDVFGQSVVNGNETRHCGTHSPWTIAHYGSDCLPRAHVAIITLPTRVLRHTAPYHTRTRVNPLLNANVFMGVHRRAHDDRLCREGARARAHNRFQLKCCRDVRWIP